MTKIREEIEKLLYSDDGYTRINHPEQLEEDLVNLFRSWALEMVKEVDIICENNGRDNACYDMRKKIEEATK